MTGTDFEPEWENAILLLEDINEPAYRVDRMLTHLEQRGVFDSVRGVILGRFLEQDLRECREIESIWQRTLELTADVVPVWGSFPSGHGRENIVLPIGAEVMMDSNSGALRFPAPVLGKE